MGFEPTTYAESSNCRRLAAMLKQYEELRLSNYFPQSVRDKLGALESDFTLEQTAKGQWQFRPIRYDTHKVPALDGNRNCWKLPNKLGPQPLMARIEALLSLAPYEGKGEVVAAFTEPGEFGLK